MNNMNRYEYSDKIANVVKTFLEDDEWKYSFNEKKGVFHFGLRIRSKIQRINYVIHVYKDEMITYGISPVAADPDNPEIMRQMAEFICCANYGLKNGCFELDFRDGEIRFKSFIDCDHQLPSAEVVENSVRCTAAMFQYYAAGFTDIIFGGASAADTIKKYERTTEEVVHLVEEEARGEEEKEPHVRMNLFGTQGGEA